MPWPTPSRPEGHIALGTGLSAFSPNLVLVRWQMALFLTRLLAADGIAAPAGVRVTVTPTDAVTLAAGNARTYTATFKNADGTPYTGSRRDHCQGICYQCNPVRRRTG